MLLVQYRHRTELSYGSHTLSETGNHFSSGTDCLQAEQGVRLSDVLLYLQVSCICHLPPPPKCCPIKSCIPAAEMHLFSILSRLATEVAEAFFENFF